MSSVLIGLRKYSFPAFVKLSARNSTQLLSKKSSHNFQKFLKSNRFGTLLTCSGLAIYYFFSPSAECMPGKSDSPLDDLSSGNFSEIFNKYFGQYSDQINQLGYSGIVGVCSGYAFKRVSKEIAFAIGGVFVFLQVCLLFCSFDFFVLIVLISFVVVLIRDSVIWDTSTLTMERLRRMSPQ